MTSGYVRLGKSSAFETTWGKEQRPGAKGKPMLSTGTDRLDKIKRIQAKLDYKSRTLRQRRSFWQSPNSDLPSSRPPDLLTLGTKRNIRDFTTFLELHKLFPGFVGKDAGSLVTRNTE